MDRQMLLTAESNNLTGAGGRGLSGKAVVRWQQLKQVQRHRAELNRGPSPPRDTATGIERHLAMASYCICHFFFPPCEIHISKKKLEHVAMKHVSYPSGRFNIV